MNNFKHVMTACVLAGIGISIPSTAETFLTTPEDFARSFMALRTEIQNEKVI